MRTLIVLSPATMKGATYTLTHHPIVAAYMAGAAERAGCEVQALDAILDGLDPAGVAKKAARFDPDMVAIVPFEYRRELPFETSEAVAKAIRKTLPQARIGFLNGVESEQVAAVRGAVKDGIVDFAVMGDSELCFEDLLKSDWDGPTMPGVLRLDPKGEIEFGGPDKNSDLNATAFPAWHYFDHQAYQPSPHRYRHKPLLPVMASRTCPFQCDFCPQAVFFTNPQHQSRSADNVIQEILTLVERYGVKEVEFYDPTFGARREEALSICQKLIDAGKPVTWSCLSRGDLLDAELTDAMAEAGCHRVLVGVESGDDAILEATGKNESLSQIRRGIGNCHRNGLDVIATFIVGLPGETPESVAKTARLARELKPTYAIFSLARMTPFSIDNPRWTEAGRITDEYSVIEGSFYGPAYVPNGFKSHRELRFHQRKAYVAFYGRPSYLVNRLMDIKTVDDARRFMNGGLTVLKQLGAGTHHLTIDSS